MHKIARALATLIISAPILLAAAAWSATDSGSTVAQPAVLKAGPATTTVDKVYKLPFPQGRISLPRIAGDWVIAVYNSDFTTSVVTGQILGYNLSTRKLHALYPGGTASLDLNGDFATWMATARVPTFRTLKGEPNEVMPSNLLVCDLKTGRYYCPDIQTRAASSPVISGNNVAYLDGRHVFLVDMLTGIKRQISDPHKGNCNHDLAIAGDYVTWINDCDSGRVAVYQISAEELMSLDTEPVMKYQSPQGDGKMIMWPLQYGNMAVYEIATQRRAVTCPGSFLDMDNSLVVYRKATQGKSVWGLFPFRNTKEFRISTDGADDGPSVSGNRVVWCKDNVVYCADLDFGDNKPIAKPLSAP